MDILSYVLGMKNGGDLPQGITKIACGTLTVTNGLNCVVTHKLGNAKHNLIFVRTGKGESTTDLCAKFAAENMSESIVYTVAGNALDTSDRVHLTTTADILEAYSAGAMFSGTYVWLAWY